MMMLSIWMNLFGTETWLNLDIGFWAAMLAVVVLVILMNVVFWSIKPKKR